MTELSTNSGLKGQFQENFQTGGWTDLIHMTLLVMARGSYKRKSQLRGIAVDSKNKIQYNSA